MFEVYLQYTLEYEGRISDRPLFQTYVGLGTVMTSLRQGRFLSKRITTTASHAQKKLLNSKLMFSCSKTNRYSMNSSKFTE